MEKLILRQSFIDVTTGKIFNVVETEKHGWASEADARKAWRSRDLFDGGSYLLDFSGYIHTETVKMIEFA